MELPPDEGIIVWVPARCDERTSPVSCDTQLLAILHTQGREVAQPVIWILESFDFLVRNLQLLQNLILRWRLLR